MSNFYAKTRFLYFLSNRGSGEIFYIGITQAPRTRYKSHLGKFGKNTTMTLFKELNCVSDDCIESYIIRNAMKIGFNLKNSLKSLSAPYIQDETDSSFDAFITAAAGINCLTEYDGIKVIYHIHEDSAISPKSSIIKVQGVIPFDLNNELIRQSEIQQRPISNLIRKYIKEGIDRDNELLMENILEVA